MANNQVCPVKRCMRFAFIILKISLIIADMLLYSIDHFAVLFFFSQKKHKNIYLLPFMCLLPYEIEME